MKSITIKLFYNQIQTLMVRKIFKLRGGNNEQSQNRGRGVGRSVRGGVGRGANRGNSGNGNRAVGDDRGNLVDNVGYAGHVTRV